MAAAMRIYHAGDLFDFKHLSGNRLLSDAVQKVSHGFYQTILPQDTEGNQLRNTSIRNGDLELVMSCHLALFNFDGTDLDSGTVVEFMITKMLDIPCVLLRTDFRNAGDQTVSSDPWNLQRSMEFDVFGLPPLIDSADPCYESLSSVRIRSGWFKRLSGRDRHTGHFRI